MVLRTLAGVATAMFALGLLTVPADGATVSNVEPLGRQYDNCTELNRDFSHGVSNRRMTRQQWIRKGATGKGAYKPNLYRRVESTMDRDNDHIACEK